MNVPTLQEFEETLFKISQSAAQVANEIYQKEKEKGNLYTDGQMRDVSSTGSTVMYLDRRKPLYKWFNTIAYDPAKFHFIFVNGNRVSINLRNLNTGQSYTLNRAAYEVVANSLKSIYGWEVYNNVDIN